MRSHTNYILPVPYFFEVGSARTTRPGPGFTQKVFDAVFEGIGQRGRCFDQEVEAMLTKLSREVIHNAAGRIVRMIPLDVERLSVPPEMKDRITISRPHTAQHARGFFVITMHLEAERFRVSQCVIDQFAAPGSRFLPVATAKRVFFKRLQLRALDFGIKSVCLPPCSQDPAESRRLAAAVAPARATWPEKQPRHSRCLKSFDPLSSNFDVSCCVFRRRIKENRLHTSGY